MELSAHGHRGLLQSRKDLEDDAASGSSDLVYDYEVDGVASIVERMRRRLDGGPVDVLIDIDGADLAHAPGEQELRGRRRTPRQAAGTHLRGQAA